MDHSKSDLNSGNRRPDNPLLGQDRESRSQKSGNQRILSSQLWINWSFRIYTFRSPSRRSSAASASTVPKGEVHAIMGPNGSGKSTLAKVLAGHPDYVVTSGSVLMDGENILELEPDERARRGLFLAFQYPSEIPGVTIANFLRAAVQARLPGGRGTGGDRLLRAALREDGPARHGSLFHLALGQ